MPMMITTALTVKKTIILIDVAVVIAVAVADKSRSCQNWTRAQQKRLSEAAKLEQNRVRWVSYTGMFCMNRKKVTVQRKC